MATRRAGAGSSAEPTSKAPRLEPPESIIDAINNGRDPKAIHRGALVELKSSASASFIEASGIMCGEGENRCYILGADDISAFLPKELRFESNCTLVDWDFMKLVPPDWYAIVFADAMSHQYRAVPEHKLALDGYPPAVTKASDPETMAGLKTKKDLRLVFYPNAFRFFWGGLHAPLRAPGTWPSARAVQKHGYLLAQETRTALDALFPLAAPASQPWAASFRAALHERHWPPATPTSLVPETESLASVVSRVGATIRRCPRTDPAVLRTALEQTGRVSPQRLDRIIDRMEDQSPDDDHRYGWILGEDHPYCTGHDYWNGGHCGCGQGLTYEQWVIGDLCHACGEDPKVNPLRCDVCKKPTYEPVECYLSDDWTRRHLGLPLLCDRCIPQVDKQYKMSDPSVQDLLAAGLVPEWRKKEWPYCPWDEATNVAR